MTTKINKTNAARLLDRMKITYTLIPYPVDEAHLGAEQVAAALGEPPEKVFKTLVLKGDKIGIFVCVLPATMELDLKKLAKATGNKHCEMLPTKELLPTTGYIRGGCSPLGMKKTFPTFVHHSVLQHDHIYCSAGVRGLQLCLSPTDLLQAAQATIVEEVEIS